MVERVEGTSPSIIEPSSYTEVTSSNRRSVLKENYGLIALISALIFCISIGGWMVWPKSLFTSHNIVTVDASRLVALKAEELAKGVGKQKISEAHLQRIANRLKEGVTCYAQEKGVIVLAKGAVWGGNLPDHTQAIMKYLNQRSELASPQREGE